MGQPDWALGYADEVWWSRFAQPPAVRTWTPPAQPLRLVEQTPHKADPDPKALACYGVLLRQWPTADGPTEKMLLRFVTGRPVSALTIEYLTWLCQAQTAAGTKVLVLVWDNASWHVSRAVRTWVRAYNLHVKKTGQGVRLLVCGLPVKSPWLNPIEPKWVYGKRQILEPDRTLSAHEVAERVCAVFDCPHEPHLVLPESKNVA
jgi:transposase